MKDFIQIVGFDKFKKGFYWLLTNTLSGFFSADVGLLYKPIKQLRLKYGIDLAAKPLREVYFVDGEGTAIVVSHVRYREELYYLAFEIKDRNLAKMSRLLNATAKSVAHVLGQCAKTSFTAAFYGLDEELSIDIVSRFVSKGHFNQDRIKFLIRYLHSLRSATFEGNHFSTGFILTKSSHDFRNGEWPPRPGVLVSLTKPINLFDPINNREWYLIDGQSFIYLLSSGSLIRNAYVRSSEKEDFSQWIVWEQTLFGGDLLFRTENGIDCSVITSTGIEFILQGHRWRFRNYSLLKDVIKSQVPISDEVFVSLLYYVMHCSKNSISSIIWLPRDEKKKKDPLKTINHFGRKQYNILNQDYRGLILRMLSSDGATIISSKGVILGFGCIVDNTKAKTKGIKGTGETAAKLLAQNGLSIKISQDGAIKIYLNGRDAPLLL